MNTNPNSKLFYERRSCYRDKFASNLKSSFGTSYHLTRDNCGASFSKYYGAYNATHHVTSLTDYKMCSRVQIVESTAIGDVQGSGSYNAISRAGMATINYATTTEIDKLC